MGPLLIGVLLLFALVTIFILAIGVFAVGVDNRLVSLNDPKNQLSRSGGPSRYEIIPSRDREAPTVSLP